MLMDELATKEEEDLPLIHPDHGEIGVTLKLCSPFSRHYSKASARIHPELFDDNSELSSELAWEIAQAEAVVTGWDGIDDEFNEENLSKLLREPSRHWITKSIYMHLSKKKGYMQTLLNNLKPL